MATFYLINTTVVNNQKILPGSLIDSATTNTAAIISAGGLLWPSSDAVIAAAAARAQAARTSRGANEDALESIMQTAVQQVQFAHDSGAATFTQEHVYIHSGTGNDNKNGETVGNAIQTFAQLLERTSDKIIDPAGKVFWVHVLADLPVTDPIQFDWTLGDGVAVHFLGGYGTPVRTGTLSGAVDKDITVNQAYEITDAALPGANDWDNYRYKLVTITSGTGVGSQAWVADSTVSDASLAARTARVSEWFAPFDPSDGFGFGAPSTPPTAGSGYKVETLRVATLAGTNCVARAPWTTPTAAGFVPYVSFQNFAFNNPDTFTTGGAFVADKVWGLFNYDRCLFSGPICFASSSPQEWINCMLNGDVILQEAGVGAGDFLIAGYCSGFLQLHHCQLVTSQTMFGGQLAVIYHSNAFFGDTAFFGPDAFLDLGAHGHAENTDFIYGSAGQIWGKTESDRPVVCSLSSTRLWLNFFDFSPTALVDPVTIPFIQTTAGTDFQMDNAQVEGTSSVYDAGTWTAGIDNKWAKFQTAAPAGYKYFSDVGVDTALHIATAQAPNEYNAISIKNFKFVV